MQHLNAVEIGMEQPSTSRNSKQLNNNTGQLPRLDLGKARETGQQAGMNLTARSPKAYLTGHHKMKKFYKDVNFDLLQARHDNFSFAKAIDTRKNVYNTIHFEGIVKEPHHPQVKLHIKQPMPLDDYTKPIAINITSKIRGGRNHSFSNVGSTTSSQFNSLSSQRNLFKQARGTTTDFVAMSAGTESGRRNEQSIQMKDEFDKFFQNPDRPQIKQTHQDFMKTYTTGALPSVRSMYQQDSAGSGASNVMMTDMRAADRVLAFNRPEKHNKAYENLNANSYSVPQKEQDEFKKRTAMMAKKGRLAMQKREEEDSPFDFFDEFSRNLFNKTTGQLKEQPSERRLFQDQFMHEIDQRTFTERPVYILQDGQDLLSDDTNLIVSNVDINRRICQMIPSSVWNSKASLRLDLLQRFEASQLSPLIQERGIVQMLFEVQQISRGFDPSLTYLYTLQGDSITSFNQIHSHCKVLVASAHREFRGIAGLEKFTGVQQRPEQPVELIKPRPDTWVQSATASWFKKNEAPEQDPLTYMGSTDRTTSLNMTSRTQPNQANTSVSKTQNEGTSAQNSFFQEVLRNEHIRVHNQDQLLLSTFRSTNDNFNKDSIIQEGSASFYHMLPPKSNNEPEYPYIEMEEQLVQFILEKIIAMREVPLMAARNKGETTQNVSQIKEIFKNFNTNHFNFAAKPVNRRGLKVDLTTLKVRDGYDGMADFDAMRAGQATFKNKKAVVNSNGGDKKEAGHKQSSGPPQHRTLTSDEIKQICTENGLSRGDVYQIRSSFVSMCSLSDSYLAEKGIKKDALMDVQEPGISIEYFCGYASFLRENLVEINQRLLTAAGCDVNSSRSQVDWPLFLKLFCIFERGQIDKQSLTTFWCKFFDPAMIACSKKNYLDILEQLIRGKCLSKPHEATKLFAKDYARQLKEQGCIQEKESLNVQKLREAFLEDRIDLNELSDALRTQM